MTVCLKSSSRSLGKKQSIRSQVISQRSEYPVRESALWNIPAVSITSSIFFRDSGMASSCNQRHSSGHREWTYSNEQKLKTANGLPWKQRPRGETMEQNGFGRIKRVKKTQPKPKQPQTKTPFKFRRLKPMNGCSKHCSRMTFSTLPVSHWSQHACICP